MEDAVDTLDGVDLDGDVAMDRDGEDEEDKEEEDEKEEEELDQEEEEDEDEDNSKESQTIGHGEMVNTSAGDTDTMVDYEPTVLHEHGQEMRGHTPWPQPPAPALRPQILDPRPQPRTLETHTFSGLEFLGIVTAQKAHSAAPTLREAEAAGNTSDANVDQQLIRDSAGGDSLPNVPPGMSHFRMSPSPMSLSPMSISLRRARIAQKARSELFLGLQRQRPFGLGSGSCLVSIRCCNLIISGTD